MTVGGATGALRITGSCVVDYTGPTRHTVEVDYAGPYGWVAD